MVREQFLNHLRRGEKNHILFQYYLDKGGTNISFSTFHQALTLWVLESSERMAVLNDIVKGLANKFEVTYLFDKHGNLILIS